MQRSECGLSGRDSKPPALPRWFRWLTAILLALPLLLSVPGCGGCTKDPAKRKAEEEERKRREEAARREKPKPPFEPFNTAVWPLTHEDVSTDPRIFVKPGHWMHVTQRTRANNNDFNGEIATRCVDRQSRRIELERSPYQIVSTRPISLPKSRTRETGSVVFFPDLHDREYKQLSIQSRLVARGSGREVTPPLNQPTESLQSHQYFTLVLARSPERYGHLPKLATFNPPNDQWDIAGIQLDYVVAIPKIDRQVPLPSHPLAWTSLAYILWDDVEPEKLTLSQQEALVDWLHWGGQLIVIAPRTVRLLRGSFLAEYLPVDDNETVAITEQALAELNDNWSIAPRGSNVDASQYRLSLRADAPLQVAQFRLRPHGYLVPHTAGLVAEARVGRGRIAVTALGLDHPQLRAWKGYDGFINGAVLRRPARRFELGDNNLPRVRWANYPQLFADARINTSLRYFSRDASVSFSWTRRWDESELPAQASIAGPDLNAEYQSEPEELDRAEFVDSETWNFEPAEAPYDGYRDAGRAGVAGWSDFSAPATEARRSLQRAAGISVPNGRFVVSVLGIYLFCLVPLNWFVFRLMGRVEWAWFAAPVIAVLGAVGVIRSAHLDIGFVRSRTEIAIVEMQPNHQRAHVSRFTGLYTSLSTQYTSTFEDEGSLALPFSTAPPNDRLRQQPIREVDFHRDETSSLQGFSVLSNSTGMMRSESMWQAPGSCRLEGRDRDNMLLINELPFALRQVVVAGRFSDGFYLALLPELGPGKQAALEFQAAARGEELDRFLERSEVTSVRAPETEVSLRGFYRLGLNAAAFQEGDCRVVAWCDQEVPGMRLHPKPNQETFRTFVIAHLRYRPWGPPQADANSLAELPPPPANN